MKNVVRYTHPSLFCWSLSDEKNKAYHINYNHCAQIYIVIIKHSCYNLHQNRGLIVNLILAVATFDRNFSIICFSIPFLTSVKPIVIFSTWHFSSWHTAHGDRASCNTDYKALHLFLNGGLYYKTFYGRYCLFIEISLSVCDILNLT